jgi:hypothetical protein
MSNIYANAFYVPTTTAQTTVYTSNATTRAIIQNIQLTNTSGSKDVNVYIYDNSTSSTNLIAHASISGPTICNVAKGPIILEENDAIVIDTSSTSNITAVLSILEINRGLAT